MNDEEKISDILDYDITNLIQSAQFAYNNVSSALENIYGGGDRMYTRAYMFDAAKSLEVVAALADSAKKQIRELAYKQ